MTTAKVQDQIRGLLEEEGTKGWNLAKRELQTQKTSSRRLRKALDYIAELPDFFRPALLSLSSKAVGGNQQDTLPCSASLILFGKAIGIHDDIIDNTKKRKKRLTAYGKFGKEVSLVLSDILAFKGFTIFRENLQIDLPTQRIATILRTIEKIWFEQAEGEIFELESRTHYFISPEQCLAKIRKRASESEAITRIGAIIGGGTETEIENLGQYGRMVGAASLLRDELIDMLEFDALRNRILNESLPLPMVYALENANVRTQIEPIIMNRHEWKLRDLHMISKVTERAGGLSRVVEHITTMVNKADTCAARFHGEKLRLIANSLLIA